LTGLGAARINATMHARELPPFHLAIPVHDLAAARRFYGGLLGCREGRSTAEWVDFDLHGHQLVCHLAPGARVRDGAGAATSRVDGDDVPIPHFGLVLPLALWRDLAGRLETAGVAFLLAPHVRFAGRPGEQGTFFIRDPSGNALEFKGFADPGELFATGPKAATRPRRAWPGRGPLAWAAVFAVVLVWSAIRPKDYLTWLLEVSPAVIGAAILAATRRRFPLTPLAYQLVLVHSIILMVGGHYTYAEVPLGEWWQDVFGAARNNYDKLGHFAQGFVPAILAREILVRLRVVVSTRWRDFVVVSVCLAISAFYELLEWWVALLSEQAAEAFLGTQGYAWDTQSDMGWALVGALTALALLGRAHDRQLRRMT
jgi:putative membrane protein